MSDKWEDRGRTVEDGVMRLMTGGLWSRLGETHDVKNTETGETREIDINRGQSLGEAIAKGQFREKKDD